MFYHLSAVDRLPELGGACPALLHDELFVRNEHLSILHEHFSVADGGDNAAPVHHRMCPLTLLPSIGVTASVQRRARARCCRDRVAVWSGLSASRRGSAYQPSRGAVATQSGYVPPVVCAWKVFDFSFIYGQPFTDADFSEWHAYSGYFGRYGSPCFWKRGCRGSISN